MGSSLLPAQTATEIASIMRVVAVCASQGSDFQKPPAPAIHLVAGRGVEGDRHFGKDPHRAVLLVPAAGYDRARQAGILLNYGSLAENVCLAGFDGDAVWTGPCLQLGQEAVVRITDPCPRCRKLAALHPTLPSLLGRSRGFYAEVLRGGIVRPDDIAQWVRR